jgi:pimeloyl-ACP methyl ester carboxylesterase
MMERRELLRALATAGMASVVPPLLPRTTHGQTPGRYQIHGGGPVLFLGSPIGASRNDQSSDPLATVRRGYLDRLTERYRVILMDYPPTGDDARAAVASFDPDHVCADILAVADAAGVDRFAWYGYSWGGVVGLQLAARTDRLSALICGGWPPLGASYRDMTAVAEWLAERAGNADAQLMVTFYRALQQWRDDEAVPKLTCPRMVVAGTDDVIAVAGYTLRIGPLIAERRRDLERLGWTVRLVDGVRHDLFTRPDLVVPLMRDFLDPILLAV